MNYNSEYTTNSKIIGVLDLLYQGERVHITLDRRDGALVSTTHSSF